MNRYPVWKYTLIVIALLIGVVYTLPNFFPEVPAVQISSSKSGVRIDNGLLGTAEDALKAASIPYRGATYTDLAVRSVDGGPGDLRLMVSLKPEAQTRIQEGAVQQNIQILRNRVNELGVAEPIIQQQGSDRVVVQLPGVQDTARAKDILGRTASLEIRMGNEDAGAFEQARGGQIPLASDLYQDRNGEPLLVRRQVVL